MKNTTINNDSVTGKQKTSITNVLLWAFWIFLALFVFEAVVLYNKIYEIYENKIYEIYELRHNCTPNTSCIQDIFFIPTRLINALFNQAITRNIIILMSFLGFYIGVYDKKDEWKAVKIAFYGFTSMVTMLVLLWLFGKYYTQFLIITIIMPFIFLYIWRRYISFLAIIITSYIPLLLYVANEIVILVGGD